MYNSSALVELIRQDALKLGHFTLASGKESNYYLDCRKVTLHSRGACLIAEGMLDLLGDHLPDLVGGMAIGADPITGALITLAGTRGLSLRGIMVRKEPKKHGTTQFVEGPYAPGERVVLVEDVITTGGSALLAIDRCQEVGLTVDRVLAIVDRLEGGQEAFAERGYDLTSLFTIRDLGL